jgi:hypothetical protein
VRATPGRLAALVAAFLAGAAAFASFPQVWLALLVESGICTCGSAPMDDEPERLSWATVILVAADDAQPCKPIGQGYCLRVGATTSLVVLGLCAAASCAMSGPHDVSP